jgi:L-ascorbate metabolism protein UlaG (beta-lactamase superfamily)
MLTALCLAALSFAPCALAQDDVDPEENPYRDIGEDQDEIMEIDDALSKEAREARMKKEIEELLEGVRWLGHAAFLIENDVVIYIDPFDLPDGLPKADLILATHGHRDHLSPEDILKVMRPSTKFVTPKSAESYVPEEAKEVITVTPDESIEVGDVRIEVVPAYNKNKDFHPKESGGVGYVVHLEGRTIYHAGDTDFIDEMKNIETDIALLPAGGKYTMDAEEAAAAANAIKPRVAIPMHWGKIVGSTEDAEKFVAECEVPALVMDRYEPEAEPETEKK